MRACDLPRSTAYHLLRVMVDEGFVVHLADEARYGLGPAAHEVGGGYARQAPLARIARRPLADLSDESGQNAHLAVLHGRDVLYLIEERAPGRPSLVTDVGVRLPAHLTATGRAVLAALPAAQVRALYPDREAFTLRHGTGPASPARCGRCSPRPGSAATRPRTVTSRPASPASRRRCSTTPGHPVAGVAVTVEVREASPEPYAEAVRRTAALLTRRLGGGPAG